MATTWVQTDFRARNDDGSETTATWIAASDTNWTQATGANVRVRFAVKQTGTTSATLVARLQYNVNSTGWYNVTGTTLPVKAASSTNITENQATTQQLSSGTFVAGKCEESSGLCAVTATIAQNSVTDFEFCIQLVTARLYNGDTLQLRVTANGTAFSSYTNTPTITASGSVANPWTPRQSLFTYTGTSATMSQTRAITPTSLGSLIIVFAGMQAGTTYSISDTAANKWTTLINQSGTGLQLWYGLANGTASTTITVTGTGASNGGWFTVMVDEFTSSLAYITSDVTGSGSPAATATTVFLNSLVWAGSVGSCTAVGQDYKKLNDDGNQNWTEAYIEPSPASSLQLATFTGAGTTLLAAFHTSATNPEFGYINGFVAIGDAGYNLIAQAALAPQHSALWTMCQKVEDFFVNHMVVDGSNPAYYTQSDLTIGNPPTLGNWHCNPAGTLAMLIDAALAFNNFGGGNAMLTAVATYANFVLANLTPSSAVSWLSVPYSASNYSTVPYNGYEPHSGAATGRLEPDKVGEVGYWLVKLYEATGTTAYLTTALQCADMLYANMVGSGSTSDTVSPWPYRVKVSDGSTVTETAALSYCPHVVGALRLFDELVAQGYGTSTQRTHYTSAAATVLTWLLAHPLTNNHWYFYYEDVLYQAANRNNYIPLETARYILNNPGKFTTGVNPGGVTYLVLAAGLITWVEGIFVTSALGSANSIQEQDADTDAMVSHTAQYGAVVAFYSQVAADAVSKQKAYNALNWSTYNLLYTSGAQSGQVCVGPTASTDLWFTDCVAEVIRHLVFAMQVYQQWAPPAVRHHPIG